MQFTHKQKSIGSGWYTETHDRDKCKITCSHTEPHTSANNLSEQQWRRQRGSTAFDFEGLAPPILARSKLCPWELFVGRTTVTMSKPKFSVAALLEVLPDLAPPNLISSPLARTPILPLLLIANGHLFYLCDRRGKKRTLERR
jgi:hypothetical protein